MPDSRHDYGPVNRIEAEAIGEPGQRTFRVLTANELEAASLWMEKQQLAALGNAIQEQLSHDNEDKDELSFPRCTLNEAHKDTEPPSTDE